MKSVDGKFSERVGWPIWLWLFLLFLAGTLSLAFWAALGNSWGAFSMLIQFLGLLFLSQSTPLLVEVDDQELRVGSARLPRKFISGLTPLTADEMRKARGPLANPAAFLAIRFWIPAGIKVEISDPNDATPYWLISSKRAHQIIDALSAR